MKEGIGTLVTLVLVLTCALATESVENGEKKALSFFNVVKFPNDICVGESSRNGTCYTAEECDSKSGEASGTCAEGYGVCCIVSLACGETSSENCTYLVQATTTKPTDRNCVYTICKAGPNVCRIRYDMTIFDIGQPQQGTTTAGTATANRAEGIGHCVKDTFSVTSVGNGGSPIICGYNTGQHLYVDASDGCSRADFTFNEDTISRTYDIKVTQYDCGSEIGGRPECLQYFTGTSGSVASFNFPTADSSIGADTTHLANQEYEICFRRESGYCALCFTPAIAISGTNPVSGQSSFGLSLGAAAIASSVVNAACADDFLSIPFSTLDVTIATDSSIVTNVDPFRHCGRVLGESADVLAQYGIAASNSACTGFRPFRITFHTDATETSAATSSALTAEEAIAPGGIVGFNLNWMQRACTG